MRANPGNKVMAETRRSYSIRSRRAGVVALALVGSLCACAPTSEVDEESAAGDGGHGGSALGADGGLGQAGAFDEPDCPTSEQYVDGECQCLPGFERCGGACVSLDHDASHCGACDHSCGDEQCAAGECECHAGSADCDPEPGLQCQAIRDDAENCGACGHTCPSASACRDGACDGDIESVRLFAMESNNSAAGFENPLVMDEQGDVYIGFNAYGEHRLLPDGGDPVWTQLAAECAARA